MPPLPPSRRDYRRNLYIHPVPRLFFGFLQELAERLERPVRRGRLPAGPRGIARLGVLHPRVLVLMAVDAEQLPVAAVGRIVVVVAVLVVHGELAQPLAAEFARAAAADPRQDLERLLAIRARPLGLRLFRLGDDAVHRLGHETI